MASCGIGINCVRIKWEGVKYCDTKPSTTLKVTKFIGMLAILAFSFFAKFSTC